MRMGMGMGMRGCGRLSDFWKYGWGIKDGN
jgi:hypothetical protein